MSQQPQYQYQYYQQLYQPSLQRVAAVPIVAQPTRRANFVPPQKRIDPLSIRRCNECEAYFPDSEELEIHQNNGEAIQCGVCKIYCACWQMLALHQTSRHGQAQTPRFFSPTPDSPTTPVSPGSPTALVTPVSPRTPMTPFSPTTPGA